jgi:hypothetical protein
MFIASYYYIINICFEFFLRNVLLKNFWILPFFLFVQEQIGSKHEMLCWDMKNSFLFSFLFESRYSIDFILIYV